MLQALYRDLGLDKKATPDQVKRVYQRNAKGSHPDTGGDAEQFARVKRAYDVLSDPKRRLTYDKTGHAEDPAPDNTREGNGDHRLAGRAFHRRHRRDRLRRRSCPGDASRALADARSLPHPTLPGAAQGRESREAGQALPSSRACESNPADDRGSPRSVRKESRRHQFGAAPDRSRA